MGGLKKIIAGGGLFAVVLFALFIALGATAQETPPPDDRQELETLKNEVEERVNALEKSLYDENELASRRLEIVEQRVDNANRQLDRSLLIIALSAVLVFLFIANNLRMQQKLSTERVARSVREADILVRDIQRDLARPQMESLRIGHLLRQAMRQLREQEERLAAHIVTEIRRAAKDKHLPVFMHYTATAMVAEYDGRWHDAAMVLERLRDIHETDVDVLLHLSHVHKNIAANASDRESRNRHLRLSQQYYAHFAVAVRADSLITMSEESPPPKRIQTASPIKSPLSPSTAGEPAAEKIIAAEIPAPIHATADGQKASAKIGAEKTSPIFAPIKTAEIISDAQKIPASPSPQKTPSSEKPAAATVVQPSAQKPASADQPSEIVAQKISSAEKPATEEIVASPSMQKSAAEKQPLSAPPSLQKTVGEKIPAPPSPQKIPSPEIKAATATVAQKTSSLQKPATHAVEKTPSAETAAKKIIPFVNSKRTAEFWRALTGAKQSLQKSAQAATATLVNIIRTGGGDSEGDLPMLPIPPLSDIPQGINGSALQMWEEIRKGDLGMQAADGAKNLRQRNRRIDTALIHYAQAQSHKTNKTLYYNWGLALLAKALHMPPKKRAAFFNAAVDKFLAGNVVHPHYFDFHLASLYAIMGDDDECRKWLQAAAASNTLDADTLRHAPDFDRVRKAPWFEGFLEK